MSIDDFLIQTLLLIIGVMLLEKIGEGKNKRKEKNVMEWSSYHYWLILMGLGLGILLKKWCKVRSYDARRGRKDVRREGKMFWRVTSPASLLLSPNIISSLAFASKKLNLSLPTFLDSFTFRRIEVDSHKKIVNLKDTTQYEENRKLHISSLSTPTKCQVGC